MNALRHGFYSLAPSGPAMRGCPLRSTPRCRCDLTVDLLTPCPAFEAFEAMEERRLRRSRRRRRDQEAQHLLRSLLRNLVKIEEGYCWLWRAGWVKAGERGDIDVRSIDYAIRAREALVHRLSESLGMVVLVRRGSRMPWPEPVDVLDAIRQKVAVVQPDGGEPEGGDDG